MVHIWYIMHEQTLKVVVRDSKNIFPWHESEDIKEVFSKISVDPITCFQVLHDYVHGHRSIYYCVKLILLDENLCGNCS